MYTLGHAKVVVRYPLGPRNKLLLGSDSSSDSARVQTAVLTVFSTTTVLTVLQEIMTETGFWGRTSSEACGRSIKPVKRVLKSVKRVLNPIKQVLNSVKQVLNPIKQVLNSVKQS